MKKENLIMIALVSLFIFSILIAITKNDKPKKKNAINPIITSKSGIALMYIDGALSAANPSPLANPAGSIDLLIDQLYFFEKNQQVKAVVIRINSPGGTTGASQELYEEVLKFKKRTKLPVIISVADMAASGAYWVALGGDTIFANRGSIVGSIGVIINNLDFSAFAQKYGISMTTIKSGNYKDMLSSWKKTSSKEKKMLKKMVDNIHSQFLESLINSLKLSKTQALSFADGRLFTGEQAKENGLIDELGGLHDAINYAATKAGIKKTPPLIIRTKNPVFQFFNLFKTYASAALFNSLNLAVSTTN